jgi:hypothetical protein
MPAFDKSNLKSFFENFLKSPFLLVVGILFICLLVTPFIFNNIFNDYRLIPYFDHDEGYGRDLAWYYYSGEKLDTFQYSLDYGAEYYLIVDLIARPLGLFISITPNILLLIIRIFHFVCGILSVFFLWRFTKRHFFSLWIPMTTCWSLIVSPHFAWWLNHVKPEPFLIMLLILSLDYTLRMFDEVNWKNFIFAIIFAAFAFSIKFIGLFLLPPMLLTLHLRKITNENKLTKQAVFPMLKKIMIIFLLVFGCLLVGLSIIIRWGSKLYLKLKTDNFDLEKFAASFNPPLKLQISVYVILSLLFIGNIGVIIYLYRKNKKSNFYMKLSVLPLFFVCAIITGYRWTTNIFNWMITYIRWLHQQHTAPLNLFLSLNFFQMLKLFVHNVLCWFDIFMQKGVLGITGAILVIMYLLSEMLFKAWSNSKERKRFLKRMVLLSYCFIFMIFLFLFQSRCIGHHLLTIMILFYLLSFEGIRMLSLITRKHKPFFLMLVTASLLLIFVNFWQRGAETTLKQMHKLRQKDDIAYKIGNWLKENYSYDTKIVADAPWCVYIPSEFKNVVFVKPRLFLDIHFKRNPENIKKIIKEIEPKLIVYNRYFDGKESSPTIETFLKGFTLKKIKDFRQGMKEGYRYRSDVFEIYELVN